jgi:hypothetical protein
MQPYPLKSSDNVNYFETDHGVIYTYGFDEKAVRAVYIYFVYKLYNTRRTAGEIASPFSVGRKCLLKAVTAAPTLLVS